MSQFSRKCACILVGLALGISPLSAGVKDDQLAQLRVLGSHLQQMKAAGQEHLSPYVTLLIQYEQISRAMGGDDPAGLLAQPQRIGSVHLGTGPGVPPSCTSATTQGANNTPQAIPDNNPVGISSTINIAGAGTYLWDVDLTTFITHTFPGDLDMTLTSPAGTVLTISTDNAATSDNAFNGTIWDNDAGDTNPPGGVNDVVYASGVPEPTVAPEESFAALIGQDPNGTWTLFIADDAGIDTGSLNSWSLNLVTLAAAPVNDPPIVGSNNTPQAIPDNNPAGISSTINLAGTGYICDVNMTTAITHTFASDLDMSLTSPGGTIATFSTDNAGGNVNVFNGTLWDDSAGATNPPGPVNDNAYASGVPETPLVPEEPFGSFISESPAGTWTLFAADNAGLDTGSLNSWSLSITTCSCAVPCQLTCPTDVIVPNDANQCGAIVTYAAPQSTGTCGTVSCVAASGSFFAVGPTQVTCTETLPTGGPGAQCSFNVTVNDTEAPVLTAPDLVVPTDPGACTGTASPVASLVSDNCPGVASSCVPPGPTFQLGLTPVTCTATDAANNQTQDPGSVTVNDLEPPVLTCPADIVQDLPSGDTDGPVSWPDPTGTDNCPALGSPTCVPPSGSTFPADTTTPVNCSILDGSGNSGTCSFNVTLNSVSIVGIPAASRWGLAGLALLLGGAAFLVLRRRG